MVHFDKTQTQIITYQFPLNPSMTRRSKLFATFNNNNKLQNIEKNKLNKQEKNKVCEKFNQYRKSGMEFLAKQELIKVLQSLGKRGTEDQIKQLISNQEHIDQSCFQQIVNDYKIFLEEYDDVLFKNVFLSLSDPSMQKVKMSHLITTMMDDFDVDISHFVDSSKFYLNFEEFKNLFS